MDNASYHNTLSNFSPPISTCSKERIWKWLAENGMPFSKDTLKAELIEALEKMSLTPIYKIDEIAKDHGHEIIRTPPYHPELQPIEICWGIVKNHIARNCDFTLSNLKSQLEEGFLKVNPSTCAKIIKNIKLKEDLFWDEDTELDSNN